MMNTLQSTSLSFAKGCEKMYLDLWKNKPSFIMKDGVKDEYMAVERVASKTYKEKVGMNIIRNMISSKMVSFTKEIQNGGGLKGMSYEIGIYFDDGYKLFVKCTRKQYYQIREDIGEDVEHYNRFGNLC